MAKKGAARKKAKKEATKKPTAKKTAKMAKTPAKKAKKGAETVLSAARVKGKMTAPVAVPYLDQARKFVPRTRIHRRRIIPKVPAGMQIGDSNPSAALGLDEAPRMAERRAAAAAAPAVLAATSPVVLFVNTQLNDLATNDTASHVCEPSVAINGDVVFYTGNWFAAVSTDGGQTFRFIDPANSFPDPPGMSFCCDQVVQYVRKIDTFVWLLQYSEDANGENIERLAFATTAEVRQGQWRLFDISAQSLGLPGIFLDYPDLAVGSNMLYLTMNGFAGNNWDSTIIVRLPLSGIQSGNVTAQRAISRQNFNFRVAQNCGTTAFFASHNTASQLRIFAWRESAPAPTFRDVNVATWESEVNFALESRTPDNRNWLGRADTRITGATKRGGELWFIWGANRGGANNRPQPYAQIARIRSSNRTLIDNLNLWDPNSAIAYGALSTNSNSEVGVSYTIGGGSRFPTHVIGIITGTRQEVTTFTSARGPDDNKWGDYHTVRRCYPNQKLFAATGWTLQAGAGFSDATPNFTIFGREGDG